MSAKSWIVFGLIALLLLPRLLDALCDWLDWRFFTERWPFRRKAERSAAPHGGRDG